MTFTRLALLALLLLARVGTCGEPAGQILRQVWQDLGSLSLEDFKKSDDFPNSPSRQEMLKLFEIPTDTSDDFGDYIRGYVHPPATGNYTFWIASDDGSELWLSSTENPAQKQKICFVPEWTGAREWTRFPTQKSQPVKLEAGKRYYIEAIHVEGSGGDNLAVGWTLPDNKEERPIPGNRLSPFTPDKIVARTVKPPPPPPTTPGFHKQRVEVKVGDKVLKVPYYLYLPPDYFTSNERYPTILFLHGAGEGGTNYEPVLFHGPGAMAKGNEQFRKQFKFIGIFPQSTGGWDPPWANAAVGVVDEVMGKWRVDQDRVYCTGLSMGGRGTWIVAQEAPKHFAAIIPLDPFGYKPEVAKEKLKDVTSWIIVGADDGDHTTGSREMYKAMKSVNANSYLTVIPQCGHGAWGRYYPDFQLYEWLFKHKRGSKERFPLPPSGIIAGMPDPLGPVPAAPPPPPPKTVGKKAVAYEPGKVGTILCQYFRDIGGDRVTDLIGSPDFPRGSADDWLMESWEIAADGADNYGTWVHGFIHPPATGDYTFWIASDDYSELWLSTTEKPSDRVKIAFMNGATGPRGWDQSPDQKSKPVKLEAGKKYYIETYHKEGGGGDNLAVGWKMPDGKDERPIPGTRLSPCAIGFGAPEPVVATAKITTPIPNKNGGKDGFHYMKADVMIGKEPFPMSFVLFLPTTYDKNQDLYPVFTFLHGNSHQGTDWGGIMNEGPPQFMSVKKDLREWFPMIAFYPQCPPNTRWDDKRTVKASLAILDELEKMLRIDKDREYVSGLSMGGKGTWLFAYEAAERWAAISPISAVQVMPAKAGERFKNLPTWIICGGDDGPFADGSNEMFDIMKAAGCPVEITEMPKVGHDVWSRYYPERKFYEWLLKYRRAPAVVAAVKPPEPVVAAVTPPVAQNPAPPKTPGPTAPTPAAVTPPAPGPVAVTPNVPAPPAPVGSVNALVVRSGNDLTGNTDAPFPFIPVTLSLAGLFFACAVYLLLTPDKRPARA